MLFKDRVRETSVSTGTGNFTLAGAIPNHQSFNTAFGIGVACTYVIEDPSNNAWEVGVGQLSSSNILVRTTVTASTNGNALVDFGAGAKNVFHDVVASFMTNVPVVNANNTFTVAQRGSITTLTDGATITPDFNNNNFFTVTLGGNRALGNPSNEVAGQSGSIFIVQDGTGSRTLSYGTDWDFAGGIAPTLTTTASAVDRLDYLVRASGSIHANLVKDVK